MTTTRYRPLDVTYPTNYPGSNNIPVPSGLLKDLGTSSLQILESNIKGGRQGWAWTMARNGTFGPSPSFSTAVNSFTGYRNPTTTADRYDFSTVGLQIASQIANNYALEPVVIAVPISFSSMKEKDIRVGITGQIFASNVLFAGMGISVGYLGWDDDGSYYEILPYDWRDACDPAQTPQNVIFNRNPAIPLGPSIRYFDPVSTTADELRYFELKIPYKQDRIPTSGTGFVLISFIGWPGASPLPGGSGKVRGTDWNWLLFDNFIDPNHLILTKNGFRFTDYFSHAAGSGTGLTGAKFPTSLSGVPINYMFKLNAPTSVPDSPELFSYHSMLQLRPEGDGGKGYTTNRSTCTIHPFIPTKFISEEAVYDTSNWILDIFPMPTALISSIFVDEIPKTRAGVNVYTSAVDDYRSNPISTGVDATASSVTNNINNKLTDLVTSPYGAANCSHRVKGRNTIGRLCTVQVLEKNEAFPWMYYNPLNNYGGNPVGRYLPSNYGTVNFEGWNQGTGYLFVESTTMKRQDVASQTPDFLVNCQVDGSTQARNLRVSYPLSIGKIGNPDYDPSLDYTIAYIPFNPEFYAETEAQGIPADQFLKGGSFNTPGMLDRFYNTFISQEYRLVNDLYPLTDNFTYTFRERASGFTNNYATAGAVAQYTIRSVWPAIRPSSRVSFLNEAYGPSEVKDRGPVELSSFPEDAGLTAISDIAVFVVYGATYTSEFTQDPT